MVNGTCRQQMISDGETDRQGQAESEAEEEKGREMRHARDRESRQRTARMMQWKPNITGKTCLGWVRMDG